MPLAESISAWGLRDEDVNMGQDFVFFAPDQLKHEPGFWFSTGWLDLGPEGYLSEEIGNVLKLHLQATLTNGNVQVNTMGFEE